MNTINSNKDFVMRKFPGSRCLRGGSGLFLILSNGLVIASGVTEDAAWNDARFPKMKVFILVERKECRDDYCNPYYYQLATNNKITEPVRVHPFFNSKLDAETYIKENKLGFDVIPLGIECFTQPNDVPASL